MNLKQFKVSADLINRSEIEKVALLAFYYLATQNVEEFSLIDVRGWFSSLGFSDPNPTRLRQNLTKSRDFNKGSKDGSYRLSAKAVSKFEEEYPSLKEEYEEVEPSNTIVPLSLLKLRCQGSEHREQKRLTTS